MNPKTWKLMASESRSEKKAMAVSSVDLQAARPHALPFRVLFEEAVRCHPQRLHNAVAQILWRTTSDKVSKDEAFGRLNDQIALQESAYLALENNSRQIATGDPDAPKRQDSLIETCADADRPLKSVLHAMNTSALCLSGGGIRSASFGLGLLEALARFSTNGDQSNGALHELDYLSTVSGGGYIGSWLMAWVFRRWRAAGAESCKASYQEVVSALAGLECVTGGNPEPYPARHLRSYTAFLAPLTGLTLDWFTLVAIILRNLLVNWVMFLPLLFVLAAAIQSSGYLLIATREWALFGTGGGQWLRWPICVVFGIAVVCAGLALPSHNPSNPSARWRKACASVFIIAVPIGCWLLSVYPVPICSLGVAGCSSTECFDWAHMHSLFLMATAAYAVLGFFILRAYLRFPKRGSPSGIWKSRIRVTLLVTAAIVVMSYIASALLCLVQEDFFPWLADQAVRREWLRSYIGAGVYATFSVPLMLGALLVSTTLFCAVFGLLEMEEDREWWMRCGGALLAFGFAWIGLHGLAFWGPAISYRLVIAAGGPVLGLVTSWIGYSGVTSAGTRPVKLAQLTALGKFLQKHNLVLPFLGGSAIALIALGVMTIAEKLNTVLVVHVVCNYPHYLPHGKLGSSLFLLAIFLILTVVANLAININLFSLQGMYRMRLMRAFLGASNVARRPDPFTNFDPKDTPLETDLPSEDGVPLHVINVTLNLVGTRNPAWRQRRAESFTLTPLFAGGWQVGYVPAGMYGGQRGVTLATALAISGAAFNPNMGYQSSPILSLLMTFFNLRLGYWLPNPKWPLLKLGHMKDAQEYLRMPGPDFALRPLIAEALGMTNDTNKWIELTDGGHFENLGLYEMVLRRCKLIVISDAGADPQCHFEDLGNAIRKIQIDLGVPIVFPDGLKMDAGLKTSNKYCAVGRIEYQWTDDPGAGQSTDDLVGYLIYIKASLNGTEPIDVRQYANVHETFPHETTANQFFDESQFESYRKLAFHEVMSIVATSKDASSKGWTLRDLLTRATDYAGGNANA